MLARAWSQWLNRLSSSKRNTIVNQHRRCRLSIEMLEERLTPSFSSMTDLAQQLGVHHAGPTRLYLAFDGVDGGTPNSSIQPYKPTIGGLFNRDAEIQQILYSVSEVFAPFNVQVRRISEDGINQLNSGDPNFPPDGATVVLLGGTNFNMSNGTKFAAALTDPTSIDYPFNAPSVDIPSWVAQGSRTLGDVNHILNSDPLDFAIVDPMTGPSSDPTTWSNSQSLAKIVQGICHEAGHTFGLAHILDDTKPDMMNYSDNISTLRFVNADLPITNLNNNPAAGANDVVAALHPDYQGQLINVQNSFTFLQTVLGPGIDQFDYPSHIVHWQSVNSPDLASLTPRLSFSQNEPPRIQQFKLGDEGYQVFQVTAPATEIANVAVAPAANSSLDPIVLVYDQNGNIATATDGGPAYAHGGVLSWFATSGMTYRIVVGAWNSSTADFTIGVYDDSAPSFFPPSTNSSLAYISDRVLYLKGGPSGSNDGIEIRRDPAAPSTAFQVIVEGSNISGGIHLIDFDIGQFDSISIDAGDGINSIFIDDTLPGVPTYVTGEGKDTITVGHAGSVLGIQGPVYIDNDKLRQNTVIVDASADAPTSGATVTLDTTIPTGPAFPDGDAYSRISGLAPATIAYEIPDTTSAIIKTADANNTINIRELRVKTYLVSGGDPTVTGKPAGRDTVNVGMGIVSAFNIFRDLYITNPWGHDDIVVDDSLSAVTDVNGDPINGGIITVDRFVPIDPYVPATHFGRITGMGIGIIAFNYFDTSNVTIKTKFANNRVYVQDLLGHVHLTVESQARDTVQIGNSKKGVQSIIGTVSVTNPHSYTDLIADNSADPELADGESATVTATDITHLAPGTISYEQNDLNSLTIIGGNGDQFTVNDTPFHDPDPVANSAGVTTSIEMHGVESEVDVLGTTGPLAIASYAGLGEVHVGRGDIEHVMGDVSLSRPGGAILSLDVDNSEGAGATAVLDVTSLTGMGTIHWAAGSLLNLSIEGSTKSGNSFTVNDTPVLTDIYLNTGQGIVDVLGTSSYLYINGGFLIRVGLGDTRRVVGSIFVTNPNPSAGISLSVDDGQDPDGRTVTIETAPDPKFKIVSGLTGSAAAPSAVYYEGDRSIGLTIYGSTNADDHVTVNATGSAPTTLNTGKGTATVNGTSGPLDIICGAQVQVGNGLLTEIQGDVTVRGPISSIALIVDDHLDSSGAAPTIAPAYVGADSINGLTAPPAAIYFVPTALKSLEIKVGVSQLIEQITTIAAGLPPVTITIANGAQLELGGSGTLDGIQSPVIINGAANNRLIFGDEQTTSPQTYTVTDTTLMRSGAALISYHLASGAIDLLAGNGRNNISITGVPFGVTTTIHAGVGGDSIVVTSLASTLDTILGTLDIEGAGNTILTVDDHGTAASQNWDVADLTIDRYQFGSARPAVPQIRYHSVASVTVNAGSAQDFIAVQSTHAGTTTVVNGGGSSDYINVENFSNSLDDIRGPLNVFGLSPYNLLITDGGTRSPHNYDLTTGVLQRDGIAPINFDSVAAGLVVAACAGGGTFNVPSLTGNVYAAIVVNSRHTVTLGSAASGGLSGINADVRVQAALGQRPHVVIDDSADGSARTINLGSDATFGYQPGTFGYVVAGLADASQGRGRIGLMLDPAAPVNILAGAGDDLFRIRDLTNAPALALSGGGGVNTLDYSAFTTAVTVNLLSGAGTGLAGISNIQNVTGGAGSDLLIGNETANALIGNGGNDILLGLGGADTLRGGSGRDLLIGGLGADLLDGGGNDDILIGGRTDYDTQLVNGVVRHQIDVDALNVILAEWALSSDSYTVRSGAIKTGVGPSAQYRLDPTTVHDDGAGDSMTGGDGEDWFFAPKSGDTISDLGYNPSASTSQETKEKTTSIQ